jgi:hypothetical protein
MVKKNQQDEIDLLALLVKAVKVIQSNFFLILFFFLIGTALGLVYNYTARKVYESKMVISSGILTRSFSEKMFDNTAKYLREGNRKAVASQLNISENIASGIASIQIESVLNVADSKEQERFIITAEVFDPEILPDLQKGLIYYLENNEFVKIRVEQNKKYFKEMLTKVEREIKDMEDLKSRIFNGDFFQSAKGNVMFDPTSVNSKIIDLTEKKLGYENSLVLANSVQVIEGFNKFERPIRPKLSVSLISGSMFGLFLVFVLLGLKSIRKLLRLANDHGTAPL